MEPLLQDPANDVTQLRYRSLQDILKKVGVEPVGHLMMRSRIPSSGISLSTITTTNRQTNDMIARDYWLATPNMTYGWIPIGVLAAAMFWTVILIKTIGWGVQDYIMYFTNWSWTLQGLFYVADLICYIDRSRKMHFFLLSFMFWPVYLTVSAVFWIVLFVTVINDKLFRQAVNEYGVGDMILGNTLVHVVPYLFIIVFLSIRSSDITQIISAYREEDGRFGGLFYAYLITNFVISVSFVVLYSFLNDYTKVYFVKILVSEAFLTVAITYGIVFFITLIFLLPAARKLLNYRSSTSSTNVKG